MEYLFIYLGLNVLTILYWKVTGEYDEFIDCVVDELSKKNPDVNRNIIALIMIVLVYLLAFPDLIYSIVYHILNR